MKEIDFLKTHPGIKRDYDQRAREKTSHVIEVAKKFDKEFFDGDRLYGYGGYRYDGRWLPVAKRMKEHYCLKEDCSVLDIGCAKGFLLHDFKEVMPRCSVAGIDVSRYAIDCSMDSVKAFLALASAESLPFPDKSFDFVVSINSIHNLPRSLVVKALSEIERVSKGSSYITVDAWRNDQEKENLRKWILTAETALHVEDWIDLFKEAGYTGDYGWFIAS